MTPARTSRCFHQNANNPYLLFFMNHHVVFRDRGYFAAWPHNGGLWQFSDGEVAVGFLRARCDYSPQAIQHNVVDVGSEFVIFRSSDGGLTWPVESSASIYKTEGFRERLARAPVGHLAEPGRSYHPGRDGYCLLAGSGIPPADATHQSWTMVSQDRGHTWENPVLLPRGLVSYDPFLFLSSRPNYVVRSDGLLLLFAFGARGKNDENLSHPVVYGSSDGGVSWGILSEIPLVGPSIMGIMPHPIFQEDGTLLVSVRRQYNGFTAYTEIYASEDGGLTWKFRSRVNDWGAPATLVNLPDGRVVCVYGYRRHPYGIRARLSADGGRSWQKEIVLRDDGGSWDLGYPRTLVRPDGTLLTVYYFNDAQDPISQNGGVRYIAATTWKV